MKRQSCHLIETSQLICSANQLTGFYMIATLVFNELNIVVLQRHRTLPKIYDETCRNCERLIAIKTPSQMFHRNLNTSLYLISLQRLNQNRVEHLQWSFFSKTVNGFQPLNIFAKNLHRRCWTRFQMRLWYSFHIFSIQLYIYIFSNIKSVNYGALIIGVVGAVIVYAIKYISQKYQSKLKFPLPAELVVVSVNVFHFASAL